MFNKIILVLSLVFISACGSGSSNEQGVSFTLLGFFSEIGDAGETPPGELGQSTPLSAENPESQSGNLAGSVSTVVGLQNNITSQFLRVDRLEMDYFIEGASIQPPSTLVAVTTILGASPGDTLTGGSSSSSSGGGTTTQEDTSTVYASFPIVPPDVMAWLNFNRASLPELPFTMIASVRASAVGSSGARYDSNEGSYFIIFTPDNVIAPD
jgi:hypothetical protein